MTVGRGSFQPNHGVRIIGVMVVKENGFDKPE